MDQQPRQSLNYVHLQPHGETAGRLALVFAGAGLLLVATSITIARLTAGSWHPVLQQIAAYSLLAMPPLCVVATISGVRGLIYPSRYRARSIIALIVVAVDIFAGVMLSGWIATGYR